MYSLQGHGKLHFCVLNSARIVLSQLNDMVTAMDNTLQFFSRQFLSGQKFVPQILNGTVMLHLEEQKDTYCQIGRCRVTFLTG